MIHSRIFSRRGLGVDRSNGALLLAVTRQLRWQDDGNTCGAHQAPLFDASLFLRLLLLLLLLRLRSSNMASINNFDCSDSGDCRRAMTSNSTSVRCRARFGLQSCAYSLMHMHSLSNRRYFFPPSFGCRSYICLFNSLILRRNKSHFRTAKLSLHSLFFVCQ